MFDRIRFKVTFQPKGRPAISFDREHHMAGGFGAIIGPNERGKSLTLEMMRFLLFGTKALRRPVGEYQGLAVDGDLTLGDDHLKIERTPGHAKIWENGELKARGTTPVNNRILERLGFGLKVFDVANSINQGDIEALSQMRPTERQTLVGSVVGLDKIDGLMKFSNDQALVLDREAKAVENTLVAPQRPAEPEGYPNRGVLEDFLAQAEKDQLELAGVMAKLSTPDRVSPADPGPRPTEHSEQVLLAGAADARRYDALTAELARLPVIDVPVAEAALDHYEKVEGARRFVDQTGNSDLLSPAQAMEIITAWDLIDEWDNHQWLVSRRQELQEKIDHADTVDCPSCGHEFPLDPDTVARFRQDLADLPEPQEPNQPRPAKPLRAKAVAEAHLERADEYDQLQKARAEAWALLEVGAEIPRYSRLDLEKYDPTRADQIKAELTQLDPIADADALLDQLRRWQIASDNYAEQLALYEAEQAERLVLAARQAELDYAPARLAELRPIVARFEPYKEALARYEQDQAAYELRLAQVAETRETAEKWRAAKEALATLRTLIKQHLYPSLAKAASVLLYGMTGGARRSIEIDDEFNVLVDGQHLDALSGSGKAVANLSIRLGLGQVLTHQVFPVIFADEIDASMDADRATSTQDILHQCSRRVSQLILVSHKKPEADWYIDLGENE